MKWFKIVALLVITLAAMRASSWAFAWMLAKVWAGRVRAVAIAANGAAFLGFVLLLQYNLMPGEGMDWTAIGFGAVVYSLYAASDWRRGTKA